MFSGPPGINSIVILSSKLLLLSRIQILQRGIKCTDFVNLNTILGNIILIALFKLNLIGYCDQ